MPTSILGFIIYYRCCCCCCCKKKKKMAPYRRCSNNRHSNRLLLCTSGGLDDESTRCWMQNSVDSKRGKQFSLGRRKERTLPSTFEEMLSNNQRVRKTFSILIRFTSEHWSFFCGIMSEIDVYVAYINWKVVNKEQPFLFRLGPLVLNNHSSYYCKSCAVENRFT